MRNNSHMTAIARSNPSAPARWLHTNMLLKGRTLDYGCGRGWDVLAYGFDGYDPYWMRRKPTGKYDTILCTYVFNVVSASTAHRIKKKILALLKRGGKAYITVRRDVTDDMEGQRDVRLRLPIVNETDWYCMYLLEGDK